MDVASFSKENLKKEDFEVVTGMINYSMKDKNTVDNIHFFNKNNIKHKFKIHKEQVSLLLPSKFGEKFLRVYVKNPTKVDAAKSAFTRYC